MYERVFSISSSPREDALRGTSKRSRLRRFLAELRTDPVGERFACERARDERLLVRL